MAVEVVADSQALPAAAVAAVQSTAAVQWYGSHSGRLAARGVWAAHPW